MLSVTTLSKVKYICIYGFVVVIMYNSTVVTSVYYNISILYADAPTYLTSKLLVRYLQRNYLYALSSKFTKGK